MIIRMQMLIVVMALTVGATFSLTYYFTREGTLSSCKRALDEELEAKQARTKEFFNQPLKTIIGDEKRY